MKSVFFLCVSSVPPCLRASAVGFKFFTDPESAPFRPTETRLTAVFII